MTTISYSNYFLPSSFLSIEKCINLSKKLLIPDEYSSKEAFIEDFKKTSHLEKVSAFFQKDKVEIFHNLILKMFQETNINAEEISYIFFTNPLDSISNHVNIPYYLAEVFEMTNVNISIVNQECSSTLVAMDLANAILNNKQEKSHILIISSSFIPNDEDRFIQFTSLGDGVGILLMSNERKHERNLFIKDYIPRSNGKFSKEAYKGTLLYPETLDDRINIVQNGAATINYICEKNNIQKESLLVIPQNVNYQAPELYSKFTNINISNFYTENIPKGGHIGDVDIIRNLTDLISLADSKNIENILLYTVGSNGADINYSPMLLNYK